MDELEPRENSGYEPVVESLESHCSQDNTPGERHLKSCITSISQYRDELYEAVEKLGNWSDEGEFMYGVSNTKAKRLVDKAGLQKEDTQNIGRAMKGLTILDGTGVCIYGDRDKNTGRNGTLYNIENVNINSFEKVLSQIEEFCQDKK
ncbi:hypothetical protein [Candidatus Nanohalococcus occultus]|uniref:hypothetical protein n=1 Tax=Candidatus Nanohalococcus occultus TaxID=2978047 RepID=UPI0039E0877C